ncbi:hypothetical protein NDU88_001435 [Pleurodeles waltl]|uniref:Uncharacterized protein n=1 Tax=Pleurodeles waltl TaxID=8319 RepID=A0AAV7THS0_PLEWA|nr:hypothetical protein NDU88_001435 [Pleurodeles waltl]
MAKIAHRAPVNSQKAPHCVGNRLCRFADLVLRRGADSTRNDAWCKLTSSIHKQFSLGAVRVQAVLTRPKFSLWRLG